MSQVLIVDHAKVELIAACIIANKLQIPDIEITPKFQEHIIYPKEVPPEPKIYKERTWEQPRSKNLYKRKLKKNRR